MLVSSLLINASGVPGPAAEHMSAVCLPFLCSLFVGLRSVFSFSTRSSMAHQTRNSRDSSYLQASSAPPTTGEENTSQPAASAATGISSHKPLAEFIATVVHAVQSTLATSPPVSSVSASMSMIAAPAVGAQVSVHSLQACRTY